MKKNIETWDAVIGNSSRKFVEGIPFLDSEEVKMKVLKDAQKILSRCSNPSKQLDRRCLLILGDVQSGKTLSFTTLISLARDNEIPFSILLAGTKRPLMKQNFLQLREDLDRNSSGTASEWFITDSTKQDSKDIIIESLKTWYDSKVPREFKKAVVLTSMKTPAGIRKVTNFVKQIQEDLGRSIPTIIVDDEGDQASPNTKVAQDSFSATYSSISDLRDSLSNHSYLSYTATPEANLLLSISDHLSPESVVVLTPGADYVGGYKLFVDRSTSVVFSKVIPEIELEIARKPQFGDRPPESLVSSLAYFLVCLTIAQKKHFPVRPISMLIHPDSTINSHSQYKKWVNSILDKWKMHFNENDLSSNQYRVPREFKDAINELRKTVDYLTDLFSYDEVDSIDIEIMKLIKFWIKPEYLEVRVVNSEKKSNNMSPNEWNGKAGWILIGAGKLDRGFVVKNLAVTYMPRGIGGGNVDTIQQRGRFFGYKHHYVELLRGWFSSELIDAYSGIVETEKDLRDKLRMIDNDEINLATWKRSLILDPSLTPTRKNIISLNHSVLNLKAGSWFQQKQLFDPYLAKQKEFVENKLLHLLKLSKVSQLDNRVGEKKHRYTHMTLPDLVEFLVDWPIGNLDRELFSKYLILLSHYSQYQPTTSVSVFLMNELQVKNRKIDGASLIMHPNNLKMWKIQNLHEGPRYSAKYDYLGDKNIRNRESISVQFHKVLPRTPDKEFSECYAIAMCWPDGFEKKVLEQVL